MGAGWSKGAILFLVSAGLGTLLILLIKAGGFSWGEREKRGEFVQRRLFRDAFASEPMPFSIEMGDRSGKGGRILVSLNNYFPSPLLPSSLGKLSEYSFCAEEANEFTHWMNKEANKLDSTGIDWILGRCST